MRKITALFTMVFVIITTVIAFGGYLVPPSGHIYTFQAGSTAHGIFLAANDKPGTVRLIKEGTDLFALGWTIPESNIGAFVCMNSKSVSCTNEFAKILKQGANVAGVKDFSALVEYLKQNGWKAVSASQLPKSVRVLASIPTLAQMANSLPTFLFVPGALLTEPELEQYKQWEG